MRTCAYICLGSVLVVGACGSDPARTPVAELIRRDLGEPEPAEQRLIEQWRAGKAEQAMLPDDLPLTEPAGADDFVRLALARNPSILAADQRALRLAQRQAQASSLDDPMVHVAPIGEMAETAAGTVSVMTGVSQRLPAPGRRALAGEVARREAVMARQEAEVLRLQIARETRHAFWTYAVAWRSEAVTRESLELLEQMHEAALAALRAGRASQQDVFRAAVERDQTTNLLIDLSQQRRTAAAWLNRLIDRPPAGPLPAPAEGTPDPLAPDIDARLRAALTHHPALQRAHEQIEAYRDRRRLARLDRFPDLTVELAYNFVDDGGLSPVATGDDQWWLGFGVNVPIWRSRLEAAEREATRGLLESLGELAHTRRQLEFRAFDALIRLEAQRDQLARLRDQIVPEARQAVEASLAGYRAGREPFVALVDNWRRWLDLRLMLHRAEADLGRAQADLHEALGQIEPAAATVETPPSSDRQP